MSLPNSIVVFIFMCQLSSFQSKFTKINSKPDNIIFQYPEEAKSERKLKECEESEACNIVHERFWLPNLVERICRCPNGFECPWSNKWNNFSMMINNRSLLKFCESLEEKKNCKRKETAGVVQGKIKDDENGIIARKVRINCKCPRTHYWKLQKYTFEDDGRVSQILRCRKQTMCERFDFCGYVRADVFSIYYRCTCPEGHLCITKDRKQEEVNEFLYSGPAYKAYCIPWE